MKNFRGTTLIVLFSLFGFCQLFGQSNKNQSLASSLENQSEHKFCNLCKERLTAKLIYSTGVTHFDINSDETIQVKFRKGENSATDLWQIIRTAGYKLKDVEENKTKLSGELYPCKHQEKAILAKSN